MKVQELEFDKWIKRWPKVFKQSQHVTVIGPTGCGKTTLVTELVEPRTHVAALGVKFRDKTMEKLISERGYRREKTWSPRFSNEKRGRIALWPTANDLDTLMDEHKRVFKPCINDVYKAGGWCLWLDEMRYMSEHLSMKKSLTMMYIAGRSNNISLVGNTQRPAWVPLEAYSQAGHLIMFRTGDERDLMRIGNLNGANPRDVANVVANLPDKHTFVHVDLSDPTVMNVTKQPEPK